MHQHIHRFRVIYGDTDMMGVVYYANYFRFFEAGRSELMRAAGVPYKELEEAGYALPVANASAKYHQPARYEDLLALETTVAEMRFTSVRITYRLVRESDGGLIATGETTHACIGSSGRLTRLPESVKSRLAPSAEEGRIGDDG